MLCRECSNPLTDVGEMDAYRLCHACYCEIMDTTKSEYAEHRMYYKQLASETMV